MADARTYERVVGLRAVTSTDGATADFHSFDMALLGRTATRIINDEKGVNRVVCGRDVKAAGDGGVSERRRCPTRGGVNLPLSEEAD